jgi:hypothetical protein
MHSVTEINTHHNSDLTHHVNQGIAWLSLSANGENTAALSYAAFELRFAIEHLAVHYWRTLLDREPEEQDFYDIESFKRIERRIYELGGHQRKIDAHFEFMRIVFGAMKIDAPFQTPQIGELSNLWHACSELCHIAWPLSCSASEVRQSAFAKLTGASELLSAHVGSLGWPVLKDAAFTQLRNRFIAGESSSEDVLAYIQSSGIWARVTFPNGNPAQFIGEAVMPPPLTQTAPPPAS